MRKDVVEVMKWNDEMMGFSFVFCRYSLQGDTKKYFSIGKYSGELKTVQALDREENSTYTMEVIAVDGSKILRNHGYSVCVYTYSEFVKI